MEEADAEYLVAEHEELLQEGRQQVARPASLAGTAAAPAPLIEVPAPVFQEELAQARCPWPAGAGGVAILAHRRSAPAPARPRGWTPLRIPEESAFEVARIQEESENATEAPAPCLQMELEIQEDLRRHEGGACIGPWRAAWGPCPECRARLPEVDSEDSSDGEFPIRRTNPWRRRWRRGGRAL